jgi:hypothetical protein
VEGEYAAEQASSRWRVLALVGAFDCLMFVVRAAAKLAAAEPVGRSLLAQLGNMALLYSLIGLLNARTRRMGVRAAHQVRPGYHKAACRASVPLSVLRQVAGRRSGAAGTLVLPVHVPCTSSIAQLQC